MRYQPLVFAMGIVFTAFPLMAQSADQRYVGSLFLNPNCPAFGHFPVDATVSGASIIGHVDGKHRIDGRFEGMVTADGRWNGRGVDPAGQVMTLTGGVGPQEISAYVEGHNREDILGPCMGELTLHAVR